MKIIYLASNPTYNLDSNSGYGTHMRGTINTFSKEGHMVRAIIGRDEEKKKKIGAMQIGIFSKVRQLKKFIPNFLWQDVRQISLLQFYKKHFQKLIEVVQNFKPDVIYERAEYLSNAGVKVAIKFNIPIFLETNAMLEWEWRIMNGKSFLNFWGKRYERSIYQNCTAIFAISEPLKEKIVKECNIERSKINVISNGVDAKNYRTTINKREIRRKFGILENELIVGYLGSFFPWHGIENLIDSARFCLKEMPNLRFLIVGDGVEKKKNEEKVKNYEIENKVIFTGRVSTEEIPNLLQIMDICVYPGSKTCFNWYGSPVKIFEYGVMAKPIICYRSNVTENIFEDKYDGVLITPGSIKELSNSILKLASNPSLREELGKRIQKKVYENYTWDKIGEKTLNIIEKVVNERK